jgi:hypothetical protein
MKTERHPNEPSKPIAAGLDPASILAVCLILSAVLFLPPRASASPFFFTTGSPDGSIGTLSRPASPGLVQNFGTRSGLLRHTAATESVSLCGADESWLRFWNSNQRCSKLP